MEQYKAVFPLGVPGSGKGTHGRLLERMSNHPVEYFYFSSGDMFRNLNPETDIGAKIKSLVSEKNFVDDKTTIALAQETLERYVQKEYYNPKTSFLLLDGLPRNEAQIQLIKPFINVKQVIDLFVPESVARERLKKRSLAEGSADDSDEIKILKRMKTYYEKTFPLRWIYWGKENVPVITGNYNQCSTTN